jgi:DNA-binding transcriptional LysR family regulator
MMDQGRFNGLAEFVETARTGSFTKAGATLGLTGSAVGKSVSRLEERLGIKLLHRTTRRLTLTHEGELYLQSCLRVFSELESTESGLTSGRSEPVGRLRLDIPAAFGRRHIMPTLAALSAKHPRLDLAVMFTERTVDIVEERVDLAIRIGTLDDDADLIARRLGTQRLLICASPGYIAKHGTPMSVDELSTRDCIIGWRRLAQPVWLVRDRSGSFIPKAIRVRHEFSDGEAMVAATLAGCGLCQLPTWLVADELQAGSLVSVLDQFTGAEMPIHAVWPRSDFMQPKLRVVIDAIQIASTAAGSGFNP